MSQKGVLKADAVQEMEECLNERDIGDTDMNGDAAQQSTPHGAVRQLDKRQIEQRIEEDRERHKRLRESIWAVNAEGDNELDRLWTDAEGSDIGEDDELGAAEDADQRRQAVEFG